MSRDGFQKSEAYMLQKFPSWLALDDPLAVVPQ